jgi:hypothetical protein
MSIVVDVFLVLFKRVCKYQSGNQNPFYIYKNDCFNRSAGIETIQMHSNIKQIGSVIGFSL